MMALISRRSVSHLTSPSWLSYPNEVHLDELPPFAWRRGGVLPQVSSEP